jgi:hypothetical protein
VRNTSQNFLQTHIDTSLLILLSAYFLFHSSSPETEMHNLHSYEMINT